MTRPPASLLLLVLAAPAAAQAPRVDLSAPTAGQAPRVNLASPAAAQAPRFELSVPNIMRGPEHVGREPEEMTLDLLDLDMIGLIEKAEAAFDGQDMEKQAQKMMKGGFSLEDWLDQMKQMKKMGPLSQIMEMLPGQMGQAARGIDPTVVEKSFKQSEAIINSMTLKERRDPDLLNASRRRRIAAGAGMQVQDVNKLIKQFRETQKMMKMLQKTGGKGLGRMFG